MVTYDAVLKAINDISTSVESSIESQPIIVDEVVPEAEDDVYTHAPGIFARDEVEAELISNVDKKGMIIS